MSRNIFYFIILMISIKVYGISPSPYSNNDVNINIKNNMLCIYTNKKNLSGNYLLGVGFFDSDLGEYRSWYYENSFDKNYPNKENCIVIDNNNFDGIVLKSNEVYDITLQPNTYGYADFISMKNYYCIIEEDGKVKVGSIDSSSRKCRNRTDFLENNTMIGIQESWFDSLIKWFKNLWK